MTKHGLPMIIRLANNLLIGDDCWIWTASKTTYGYGRLRDGDKNTRIAHVLMYEEMVGPVPDGWDVDHECHNRAAERGECNERPCVHQLCCRPSHLKAKPHGDNLRASPNTQAGINAAKTHCNRGHEFTPENTRIKKDTGWRACKACDKMTPTERRLWDAEHKGEK